MIRDSTEVLLDDGRPTAGVLELALLRALFSDLADACNGQSWASSATLVQDIFGRDLFYRVGLVSSGQSRGYVDLAIAPELGSPLVAVALGPEWDGIELRAKVLAEAKELWGPAEYELRFVAYDYPRVGVQVLRQGNELSLLAPKNAARASDLIAISPFSRRSILEDLLPNVRIEHALLFEATASLLRETAIVVDNPLSLSSSAIVFPAAGLPRIESERIKYSPLGSSHECFEFRNQEIIEWCVPATLQMILHYYRYSYNLCEVAGALGLGGTLGTAVQLPQTEAEFKVVEVLELLTGRALLARMNAAPGSFPTHARAEIGGNRPLVAFGKGHARVVAGFRRVESGFWPTTFEGWQLYDPWGSKVVWESVLASPSRLLFTACLRALPSAEGLCPFHVGRS